MTEAPCWDLGNMSARLVLCPHASPGGVDLLPGVTSSVFPKRTQETKRSSSIHGSSSQLSATSDGQDPTGNDPGSRMLEQPLVGWDWVSLRRNTFREGNGLFFPNRAEACAAGCGSMASRSSVCNHCGCSGLGASPRAVGRLQTGCRQHDQVHFRGVWGYTAVRYNLEP